MIPAILRCTFSRYTKRLCIFERVMRVRPFIRYLRAFAIGVALLPLCCMQAQEGKSSFDVLNLPVSSHINALGGNNISIVEEDITVMYHNPAGILIMSICLLVYFLAWLWGRKIVSIEV